MTVFGKDIITVVNDERSGEQYFSLFEQYAKGQISEDEFTAYSATFDSVVGNTLKTNEIGGYKGPCESKASSAIQKLRQDDEYNHILENSDDGFQRPTMESQLRGAYMGYLNETFDKGREPNEDVYEYIVNIHVDSLTKAYQDVYKDIAAGYESGTREVWTQDFEEGADYIEFELGGKNYRFHKFTMEEEPDQLNKAYEKAAKDVENKVNLMIDTGKIIEKVMPEYEAEMRSIEAQRARWEMSESGDVREIAAERIKDRLSASENNFQKVNIYKMLMEARENWFHTENFLNLKTGSLK